LSWAKNPNETGYGYTLATPQEIIQYALNQGCKGICFTYNEPAIMIQEVMAVALEAKKNGLSNFLVTNSTLTNESVKIISPLISAAATDIKSMDNSFFWNYCGIKVPDVSQKILACIKSLQENGVHVEVRTNVIPGANDSEENLRNIARWIIDNLGKNTAWHITRFFPAHQLAHLPPTPWNKIKTAYLIGIQEGLENVLFHLSKACDCYKGTATDHAKCCKQTFSRGVS
jgi:pyruvate formate lyase activating enzyme